MEFELEVKITHMCILMKTALLEVFSYLCTNLSL